MACKFLQQWSWVAYQRRTAITVYLLTLFHSSIQHTTHTHPFNGPLSRTTRVGRYQKGKINLDFTEARDSEWQWHQLGHKQVCISIQTDNHASTPPLSFLQAGCPFCHQSTAWKHWRHVIYTTYNYIQIQLEQKKHRFTWKISSLWDSKECSLSFRFRRSHNATVWTIQ